jgi:hypothetical protein
MSTAKEMGETLERLVDENGLAVVLEALAAICHEKAEHVQSNWQDTGLAKCWKSAGRRVEAVAGVVSALLDP